jgi:hypothetical protein
VVLRAGDSSLEIEAENQVKQPESDLARALTRFDLMLEAHTLFVHFV